MTGFHPRVLLVDDVDATVTADDTTILVADLGRTEAVADFHDTGLATLWTSDRGGDIGVQPQRVKQTGMSMATNTRGNWMVFAAITVGIVGLTGVFATYAAPLPLERALAREAALDAALATPRSPDPQAALAALADRLGDSAAPLAGAPDGLPARVAAERLAMRTRFAAESAGLASQLRLLIIMITLMGAIFVVAIVGGFSRGRS